MSGNDGEQDQSCREETSRQREDNDKTDEPSQIAFSFSAIESDHSPYLQYYKRFDAILDAIRWN